MKNKIKLTDLSHLEPLNEDMAHLKGGDNPPEDGILCWGCKCYCECTNLDQATTESNDHNSKRNNGNVSGGIDIAIIIVATVIAL